VTSPYLSNLPPASESSRWLSLSRSDRNPACTLVPPAITNTRRALVTV
jgi:hypothetical protein